MKPSPRLSNTPSSRREFLKGSAAAVVGSALAPGLAGAVHIAGSDVIRVGLIGCGGRGTGAAENALLAGPDVRLVAMGDVFADRFSRDRRYTEVSLQIQVDPAREVPDTQGSEEPTETPAE